MPIGIVTSITERPSHTTQHTGPYCAVPASLKLRRGRSALIEAESDPGEHKDFTLCCGLVPALPRLKSACPPLAGLPSTLSGIPPQAGYVDPRLCLRLPCLQQASFRRASLLPPPAASSGCSTCLRLPFASARLGMDFARYLCHNTGHHH